MASSSSTKWLYVSLAGGSLVVVFLMGLAVFETLVGLHMGVSPEDAETMLIRGLGAIILLSWATNRTWKKILKREWHSSYVSRHRNVLATIAVSICTMLLAAGFLGDYIGRRNAKNRELENLLKRAAQMAPATLRFRERLGTIRGADTPTFQAYYHNCLELEVLLDEWEPTMKQGDALLEQFERQVQDRPEFLQRLPRMKQLRDIERRLFELLRKEITHSKKLVEQPSYQQEAYYVRYIEPIQTEIGILAEKEIELLKEAEKQGVKLPSDLSDLLK